MPEHNDVQVVLKLPQETLTVPRQPFKIPSQSFFFWPINLDVDGALLKYATAQPFAKLDDGKQAYYFFVSAAGVPTEFAFDAATVKSIESKGGTVSRQDHRFYVDRLKPSTSVALTVLTSAGKTVHIALLSQSQAENSWKISLRGHPHMLITAADVFADDESIHLRSRNSKGFLFALFPDAEQKPDSTAPLRTLGSDGIFSAYKAALEPKELPLKVEKVRDADPSSPAKMGKVLEWRGGAVALAPDEPDFEKAAVWRLTIPKDTLAGLSDAFLDIHYHGDVARLYEGTRLLDDNFFNGGAWK